MFAKMMDVMEILGFKPGSKRNDLRVFLIFLSVRIISVFFVQTFYVPDEYWQSLEVAHNLVFGYGYLTWEWIQGIRSYVHPLIFAVLYKILEVFELDSPLLLIYLPRILQAILSAYSDLCFYQWSGAQKWAIFCMATSWFWFYTGSRTLINTFETCVTTIILSKFPWPGKGKGESLNFIWLIFVLCIIRPTAAIVWFPICLYHLYLTKYGLPFLILTKYFPKGVLVLLGSIILDTWAHGKLVVTAFEFLKFNVLQGGASAYGSLPWHWYLSSGLPAILGINLLPFVLATSVVLKNTTIHLNELVMLVTIVFTVGVLSFLPHKEFRFLLPILPLSMYITSKFLSAWSRKASPMMLWITGAIIFAGNVVPAWYFGMIHQRGTLDVMGPLRDIAEQNKNSSFLFLMPCHATPLYSHLHVNVTTRFLTCNPKLDVYDPTYIDEVEEFYRHPNTWLRSHYPPNGTLPSHLITFDNLVPVISDILSRYKTIHSFFHTQIPVLRHDGQYVLIHERVDFN